MKKSGVGIFNNVKPVPFILIPLLLKFSFLIFPQQMEIKFKSLTEKDGLSQEAVYSIFQDSHGFMWFGTQDGLNRYDGYKIKVYTTDPTDPSSLSSSHILSICEDNNRNIWVGTEGGGLNKLNRATGKFTRYTNDPLNPRSITHNTVNSVIYSKKSNNLWIGTGGGGLNKFDVNTNSFTSYTHDPENPHSIPDNRINIVYEDKAGSIWIGAKKGGICRLSPKYQKSGKFTHFTPDTSIFPDYKKKETYCIMEDREGILWISFQSLGIFRFYKDTGKFDYLGFNPAITNSLSKLNVSVMVQDNNGRIWFGHFEYGIDIYDKNKDAFYHCTHSQKNPKSINYNNIKSLFLDRSGTVWIGTNGRGINMYFQPTKKFRSYKMTADNPKSLNFSSIRAIYEDEEGRLWIGGYGGIDKVNRKTGNVTAVKYRSVPSPDKPVPYLYNTSVYVIKTDAKDPRFLWVGTEGGGIYRFNKQEGDFFHYPYETEKKLNSLYGSAVYSILPESSGMIYIGTENGLNILNAEINRFISFSHDPEDPGGIAQGSIRVIFRDKTGKLWVGSSLGGISCFDEKKAQFTHFNHDPQNSYSLSNNSILSIYESRSGVLWLGTAGGGLNKFNREQGTFYRFTKKDGLPNNVIYGILEDNEGNLWLSTNRGLSKFDPRLKTFRNYDSDDSLTGNEFNAAAYFKNNRGEMFFGGLNGVNYFFPSEIKDNPYKPEVIISSFKKANVEVVLDKPISEKKELYLSHKDRIISFEFAALSFISPEKNQYACMLEGLNNEWIQLGGKRDITFTNLNPGKYVLRVKASNNDGIWNQKGVSLKIFVAPPFWQTTWFYILTASLIIFLGVSLYKLRINQLKKRAKELKQKVAERTAQLETSNKELEAFSYSMAHDLRAPLRAINGFARALYEDYEEKFDDKGKDYIHRMCAGVDRMARLIDDLLNLASISKVEMKVETVDMSSIISNILSGFQK
ncbi:MAG: hypothetical protein KAT34_13220, partial [Candidatus Aminicenantes bacterium]|nr:hypothetical protein [Candidatus Aminicenantes bacterium]